MKRIFNKDNFKNYLIPFFLFGLVIFVMFPHLFTGFSNQIEENDGRLLAWTVSWNINTLFTNPTNLYNANIFYPNSNTLTYSEHFLGGSILAIPVYLLSGGNPTASFNFLMILGYVLNAFCAYILLKHLTKNRVAAFVGALIFGYCSYRIFNYAHLQNMLVFYIPLLTYFLIRYFEDKRKRFLLGAGVSLLMMSLTSWYHMIFIWLLFGLLLLYFLFKKQFTKKDFVRIGLLIGINLVVILPFALPYFEFNRQNQSAYSINDLKTYSADLGGYLLPPPSTFIGGEVLPLLRIEKERWQENMNFIGFIALMLSLIGILTIKNNKDRFEIRIDKSKVKYVIAGGVFFIFSLGPFLHIADQVTRIPLVYWFIYTFLPPIRFIRVTARFATVFYLFVSILAAFGMAKLLNRFKNNKFLFLFPLIISVLIIAEYYPYNRFYSLYNTDNTPEVYNYIKNNEEVRSIIELPINVGPFTTTKYVYYAGVHFKPIVNGYSGFEPKDYKFNKFLFENYINDLGVLKLNQIGVTHVLINPGYEYNLDLNSFELVKDAEGYKLYRIKNLEINEKGYFTDFSGIQFKNGFTNVDFKFNNSKINIPTSGTPIFNVSPISKDSRSSFNIESQESFDRVIVSFRSFDENDQLRINCITEKESEFEYTFTKANYLDNAFEFNCSSNKLEFDMLSTEISDRTMITSIGLIGKR